MIRYSANNRLAGTQQNIGTAYKTALTLFATTGNLCRGELVDYAFGADGAPNATDCQIVYDISRITAVGTATAATPIPLDGVSTAATSCNVNHTAEPTVTAASSLDTVALNQRASLRVFLDVGLRWPATANAGLCMRALSPTYATAVLFRAIFQE